MKVGFVQNNPIFGDIKNNLARALGVLADENADLFVLPELFTTGYQFINREEAWDFAETIPPPSPPPSSRNPFALVIQDCDPNTQYSSLVVHVNTVIALVFDEDVEGDSLPRSALLRGRY